MTVFVVFFSFSQFVKTCFGPFSARLSVDGVYLNLQKETDHLHLILQDEVDRCVSKRIITEQKG